MLSIVCTRVCIEACAHLHAAQCCTKFCYVFLVCAVCSVLVLFLESVNAKVGVCRSGAGGWDGDENEVEEHQRGWGRGRGKVYGDSIKGGGGGKVAGGEEEEEDFIGVGWCRS